MNHNITDNSYIESITKQHLWFIRNENRNMTVHALEFIGQGYFYLLLQYNCSFHITDMDVDGTSFTNVTFEWPFLQETSSINVLSFSVENSWTSSCLKFTPQVFTISAACVHDLLYMDVNHTNSLSVCHNKSVWSELWTFISRSTEKQYGYNTCVHGSSKFRCFGLRTLITLSCPEKTLSPKKYTWKVA